MHNRLSHNKEKKKKNTKDTDFKCRVQRDERKLDKCDCVKRKKEMRPMEILQAIDTYVDQ